MSESPSCFSLDFQTHTKMGRTAPPKGTRGLFKPVKGNAQPKGVCSATDRWAAKSSEAASAGLAYSCSIVRMSRESDSSGVRRPLPSTEKAMR